MNPIDNYKIPQKYSQSYDKNIVFKNDRCISSNRTGVSEQGSDYKLVQTSLNYQSMERQNRFNHKFTDVVKHISKNSRDSPEWFQSSDEISLPNSSRKKSMYVFSGYNGWITVDSDTKSRNPKQENIKVSHNSSSNNVPEWMQQKYIQRLPNVMKKSQLPRFRHDDSTKRTILIDRHQNPPTPYYGQFS